MRSSLPKMVFNYDDMRLDTIYRNQKYVAKEECISSPCIEGVLGEEFGFQENPYERPYVYNSVVMSIDGKIAFDDIKVGPLIASKNEFARKDAAIDWWMLNLLRSSADGIIFGANTLNSESEATGHVYDQELEDLRVKRGLLAVPINVIPTLDGLDIPEHHTEFKSNDIPIVFVATKLARINLNEKFTDLIVIGSFDSINEIEFTEFIPLAGKKYIVICGSGRTPDIHIALAVLKKLGVNRLLVESPTLTHIFLQEDLMDELFINISCIYVGGGALSIGQGNTSFKSIDHPHTELIRVYMHSPNFMFTRHRIIK